MAKKHTSLKSLHIRRIVTFLAVTLALTLFGVVPASATPYPETLLPDSTGHSHCFYVGWGATDRKDVFWWARDRVEETDIDMIGETCSGGTDVRLWDAGLASGSRGEWECLSILANGRCDISDVRIDFPEIDIGSDDWYDRRKTMVHELGHSVGLGHHSPSEHDCAMVSGEIPCLDIKWRVFHSHDKGHINAVF